MRRLALSLVLAFCLVSTACGSTPGSSRSAPTGPRMSAPDASVDGPLIALLVFHRIGGDGTLRDDDPLDAALAEDIVQSWDGSASSTYEVEVTDREELVVGVSDRASKDDWDLTFYSPSDDVFYLAFEDIADDDHPLQVDASFDDRIEELTGMEGAGVRQRIDTHLRTLVEQRGEVLVAALAEYLDENGTLPESTEIGEDLADELDLDIAEVWEFPPGEGYEVARDNSYSFTLTDGFGVEVASRGP